MNLSHDNVAWIKALREVAHDFLKLGPFWQLVLNDRFNICWCHDYDLLNDLLKFFVVDTIEVVPAVLPLKFLLKRLSYYSNLSI